MDVIFHQAALGDFALTLPLLRGLGTDATVVAPWSHGRLATRLVPGVNSMDIEMFEFTRLFADGGPSVVSPAVQALFEDATRIVSFIAGPDSAWAKNVRRLAPQAALFFVAARPTTAWDDHVTRWHQKQLKNQGLVYTPEPCGIASKASQNTGDGDHEENQVVIHPGSGGVAKCWAVERFVKLAARLRDAGRSVRFVVGEAEVERGVEQKLEAHGQPNNPTICRDLDTFLALLNDATLYLGHDAGPTHVAAQAAVRTVALFGPTDPAVWSPLGPDVTVLAPDEPTAMDWLDVDRVLDAIR